MVINGLQFTPNGAVTISLSGTNVTQTFSTTANASGQINYTVPTLNNYLAGSYQIKTTDNISSFYLIAIIDRHV